MRMKYLELLPYLSSSEVQLKIEERFLFLQMFTSRKMMDIEN